MAGLASLAARGRDDTSLRVLATASAASLGAISLVGPLSGRISRIYLVDAALEAVLVALWLRAGGVRAAVARDA